MSPITLRRASDGDLDLLARFNKQLIEDEGHENSMDVGQLRSRMEGFLHGDYQAFLFEAGGVAVGYALVNMTMDPLYLRQFFIDRDQRKKGYGTMGFRALMEALGADVIDVDVLVWNVEGMRFWRSLGFKDRSVQLRYAAPPPGREGS